MSINGFEQGVRVVSTDKAIKNGVFRKVTYGTVHRTPRQARSVKVVLDGTKCATYYHQTFWQVQP